MIIKKLYYIALLSYASLDLHGVVATGDTADSSTTFQFSVGKAIYDSLSNRFWTLSGQDTSQFSTQVQSYGIAYTPAIPVDGALQAPLISYPALPTQAIITTTNEQGQLELPNNSVPNPLLGKAFLAVTFVSNFITVVTTNDPEHIYILESSTFSDGLYGKTSPVGVAIMNQINVGQNYQVNNLGSALAGTTFITKAQGIFGTDPSAISFATTTSTDVNIDGKAVNCLAMQEQATTPISTASTVLTAGGASLATLGSHVSIYPCPLQNGQVYVGFGCTSATNGFAVAAVLAQAVTATEEIPASLNLISIIPNAVATSGITTPISTAHGQTIHVDNITTTMTSTGLSYMISSYDNGTGQQSIYALPLVTAATDPTQNGMIADHDQIATVFKISGSNYRTQGFSHVISDAQQIALQGTLHVQAYLQVGHGAVPVAAGQTISQLMALGDAVYITIQDPFDGQTTPGMFKSQALFDTQGRISNWTPWQRITGTDDQILFAIKMKANDATIYVSGQSSNIVQQTTWNNDNQLTPFLQGTTVNLQKNNGGVQGIFAFPPTTSGFTAGGTSKVSLLVATGNNAATIAQTGQLVNNQFEILPQTNDTWITLNQSNGLRVGSIVACDFGTDNAGNNWLFLAGSDGLAVLSSADGSGFTTLPNSGAAQALLANGATCKTIGNFSGIKKIVFDATYLYIMTQYAVYRFLPLDIQFTATNPAPLNVQLVTTSSALAPHCYCTDMLASQGLIIIGTTAGCYSIYAQNSLPGIVKTIPIPGGLPVVSRLQTISNQSSYNQDFYTASNLYLLSIDYQFQQSCINRYTIDNGLIEPIQDQLFEGQNGPLVIFDDMKNNLFIDGSLGFATSYKIGIEKPLCTYLQFTLQAGKSSTQYLLSHCTTNLQLQQLKNSLAISGIVRDYASGALVLAADFGILADL